MEHNDQTSAGKGSIAAIHASADALESDLTAMIPDLSGARDVDGWTGVAQAGAELVVERADNDSTAVFRDSVGWASEQSAFALTDRSTAAVLSTLEAAGVAGSGDLEASSRLATRVASFLGDHADASAFALKATAQRRRAAGVGIDLGPESGSILIYRRLTALTAHSR